MLALAHLGWTLRQSIACSQFAVDVEKLGEPANGRQLLSYLDRFERLVKRWARDAENIEPSRMYLKRHRELVAGIAGMQRAVKKIRTDFADRDRAGYDRGVKQLERAEKDVQDHPISCAVGS